MARLHLQLLGGFRAHVDARDVPSFGTRKVQALVAYLALPTGRFHSREKLTALLWGDTGEAQARQSFRQALAHLRRAVGEGEPPVLLIQQDHIALNPQAVAVDVAELESVLTGASDGELPRATRLYKGDLLAAFRLDERPFEEWLLVERERLRALARDGLARLLRAQSSHAPDAAIQTASRMLAIDPLDESVHRTLMRLLVGRGRRAEALQQYQVCVGWLQRELGTEPEEATRQLYRGILKAGGGDVSDQTAAAPLATTGIRFGETGLLGRAMELGRLREALAQVTAGHGRMVTISGEVGIGKSRLVQELGAAAVGQGARVLVGRCYETAQALPLHPWIDALRAERPTLDPGVRDRLGAAVRGELSRAFPELRGATDLPGTVSAQHARLFDALAELMDELVAGHPTLMVLEDLHWADAMSARLLAFVEPRMRRWPLLIVGTFRPEHLVDSPVLAPALQELRAGGGLDEISLAPLSREESESLVHALIPRGRLHEGEGVLDEIWSVSEGNPFVIVESVRALAAEPSPAGRRAIARSVRESVDARLDRLSDRARHVVGIAATIGRDFPFALLQRAAHLDERAAAEIVEELVRRRIVNAVGDHLGFCHDVVRQVAHDRVLAPYRPGFHLGIAQALIELHAADPASVADRLAHHFTQASMPAEAIESLVRYAERSTRLYALDEAIGALEDALGQVPHLPPTAGARCRVDLLLRLAEVLSIVGRFDEILARLLPERDRLRDLDDPARSSAYWCRLALTYTVLERDEGVAATAPRAVAEAEKAGDHALLGRAWHVLATHCFTTGAASDGVEYSERAIGLLRNTRESHWLGQAYWILGLNQLLLGAFPAALAAEASALTLAAETGDQAIEDFALSTTALILLEQGDPAAAIERCEAVLARPAEYANGLSARACLGRALLDLGQPAKAVALLENAAAALRPFRTRGHIAAVMLAEAYVGAGQRDLARRVLDGLLDPGTGARSPWLVGRANRIRGALALAEGDRPEAARHLQAALDVLTTVPVPFEIARTLAERERLALAAG